MKFGDKFIIIGEMKKYEGTRKLLQDGLWQNYQQMRIYCLKENLARVYGIFLFNLDYMYLGFVSDVTRIYLTKY